MRLTECKSGWMGEHTVRRRIVVLGIVLAIVHWARRLGARPHESVPS